MELIVFLINRLSVKPTADIVGSIGLGPSSMVYELGNAALLRTGRKDRTRCSGRQILFADVVLCFPMTVKDKYTFTDDGAWCWFQDPRAVQYTGDHDRTDTKWVTVDGDIEVPS